MKLKNKNINYITILVTIAVIVSKVFALLRETALAYTYGTTNISDAYTLTQSILMTFEAVFTASALAFLPIYSKTSIDRKKQYGFLNNSYTILSVIALVFAAICVVFSPAIVNVLGSGFDSETKTVTVSILRIYLLTIPLCYIITTGAQHLRGEDEYLLPSVSIIPLHIIVILSLLFSSAIGIEGVAWCYLFGMIVQLLWQHIHIRRKGYRYRPSFNIHDEGVMQLFILAVPILIGSSIETITTMISKAFAATLAEGSVAALNYANKLSITLIGLIAVGPATVWYAGMSKHGAKHEYKQLGTVCYNALNVASAIIVPLSVGLVVLRVPITKILFEHGAFGDYSSEITCLALAFYSIGLVGHVVRIIVSRAFFAVNDIKSPLIVGIGTILLCILGSALFVKSYGVAGLAAVASASTVIGAAILLWLFYWSMKKKNARFMLSKLLLEIVKVLVSSAIMGAVVYFTYYCLCGLVDSILLNAIFATIVGIIVYALEAYFLNIISIKIYINILLNSVLRRRHP